MRKSIFILSIFGLITLHLKAQQLLFNGKITFAQTYNLHKIFMESDDSEEEGESEWRTEYLKRLPKHKTDIYELKFTPTKTIYRTFALDENPALNWSKTDGEKTYYTNFKSDSCWAYKIVYDKKYLVQDSIAKPIWKITGEYREIAGYMCRRATSIMYDSVFVIAFYTDAIPVSGGPDMYANLPGMILGVVIPRFNFTLFATKVESATLTDADFVLPNLRKPIRVNRAQYQRSLLENTSDWGDEYSGKFVLRQLFE